MEDLIKYLDKKIELMESIGYPASEADKESWAECASYECIEWGESEGRYQTLVEIRNKIINEKTN